MGAFIDLAGQRFGMLTVIGRKENRHGHAMWECLCDCGNKTVVPSGDLRRGKTKSCGCNRTTHGDRGSRLYGIWIGIKTRCFNETDHTYALYGGRGITVCEEWRDSFEAFRDWALANGYRDDLSIDRKNPDGDYCPVNCRWTTMKEQQNNRRNNRLITYNGRTQTLSQWSAETGIHRGTIQYRLKHGWDVEKALTVKGDLK